MKDLERFSKALEEKSMQRLEAIKKKLWAHHVRLNTMRAQFKAFNLPWPEEAEKVYWHQWRTTNIAFQIACDRKYKQGKWREQPPPLIARPWYVNLLQLFKSKFTL